METLKFDSVVFSNALDLKENKKLKSLTFKGRCQVKLIPVKRKSLNVNVESHLKEEFEKIENFTRFFIQSKLEKHNKIQ